MRHSFIALEALALHASGREAGLFPDYMGRLIDAFREEIDGEGKAEVYYFFCSVVEIATTVVIVILAVRWSSR